MQSVCGAIFMLIESLYHTVLLAGIALLSVSIVVSLHWCGEQISCRCWMISYHASSRLAAHVAGCRQPLPRRPLTSIGVVTRSANIVPTHARMWHRVCYEQILCRHTVCYEQISCQSLRPRPGFNYAGCECG